MAKTDTRPAARPPAALPPSCGGCEWFLPPKQLPEGSKFNAYVSDAELGVCARFPQPVRKKSTERCGEFSPLREGE